MGRGLWADTAIRVGDTESKIPQASGASLGAESLGCVRETEQDPGPQGWQGHLRTNVKQGTAGFLSPL